MNKIVIILVLCAVAVAHEHHHGHGHGHSHGNMGEDPKFKYSKQANIPKVPKSWGPDFPPMQEEHLYEGHKDHGHAHGHEDHGHSHGHEDHRHTHEHEEHDHAHGHEGNEHSNGHEEDEHFHGNQEHEHEGHEHSHVYEGHSDSHEKHDAADKHMYTPPPKKSVFWLEPILATALISAAPFLILFVVPLNSNAPENQPFLKILLSFASGGLLGDAFLHLIPHAISPHAHDGQHSHEHAHNYHGESHEQSHDHTGDMIVGLWVLAGIIAFLVVEKLVRHIKGGHVHSHGHSHKEDAKKDEKNREKRKDEDKAKDDDTEEKEVKISAYLNLAADCTHNFTDGLAIGASFLVSRNVGLITTLTIFLHEIPHEIGDFAILIQSGCTKRKAMMLQLLTAVGAFAGCICGLLAEGLGAAAVSWILPFTAGGFIYIATVSVIPELLEESKLTQSMKEIFALLVGVFLMVVIALTE